MIVHYLSFLYLKRAERAVFRFCTREILNVNKEVKLYLTHIWELYFIRTKKENKGSY